MNDDQDEKKSTGGTEPEQKLAERTPVSSVFPKYDAAPQSGEKPKVENSKKVN